MEETKDPGEYAGHEVASQPNSQIGRDGSDGEERDGKDDWKAVDKGGFNMNEIRVALGNGNLDEERYERLKHAFETLLDWTMGKW